MCPEWVKTEKDESVLVIMHLSFPRGIDFEQRNDGYRLYFPSCKEIGSLIVQLLPHIEPISTPENEKRNLYLPLLASLFKYEEKDQGHLPPLQFTSEEIIGVGFTHHQDRGEHYVNFRLANPKVAQETFLTLLPISTRMKGIKSQPYLKNLLITLGMFDPTYINTLKDNLFPADTDDPAFKVKYATNYDLYDKKLYYDELKERIDSMLQETSKVSD